MLTTVLIPLSIAYAGLVLWIISRYYAHCWVPVAPRQDGPRPYPLARAVRILLGIVHCFAFLAVIAWLPASIVIALSANGNPDWGAQVEILSGFRLDLARLPGVAASGFRDPVIDGTMTMTVDFLNGAQWLVFALGTEIKGILGVYVILQLRNIFAELSNGTPFKAANELRLRRIGIVLIVAYAAQPFWQFFMWGAVIGGIETNPEIFSLHSSFGMNGTALLLGLGLLAFSGAMREAGRLQEEQRLTI